MKVENKSEVNFYFIKSTFGEIIVRLCKKLLDEEKKILINLKDETEMSELDKFIWTKEKDSFLPHKMFNESIKKRDKIILFNGNYLTMSNFKNFEIILVSPNVVVKKISIFKKFFLFSNKLFDPNLFKKNLNILKKNEIKIKCFHEFETLKWKSIPT